jgi:hypothetical protein
MMISTKAKLSVTEIIGFRCAFSIYAGWLTAATILNISIVLKDLGKSDSNADMWISESW